MLISCRDQLFITQASTGLNDCSGSGPRDDIKTIAEGKISVRSNHRPLGVKPEVACTRDRELGRVHSAHLPSADAHHSIATGEDNGIRLDMLTDAPGKVQGSVFFRGWSPLGYNLAVLYAHAPEVPFLQQHAAHYWFRFQSCR